MPQLLSNGQTADQSINLLPLITLTSKDIKTSLLNILMLVPFGFGLPFITNFSFRKIVTYGFLFSLSIEVLQWLSGMTAGVTFRVADVNDLLFNTLGVGLGYLMFLGVIQIFSAHKWINSDNPIARYIAKRPQIR